MPEVRPAGRLARWGLAIVRPRQALAIARQRANAGRSGSDLLVLIVLVLAAAHLRALFVSVWLGARVDAGLGARAVTGTLADALAIDFTFLAIAALALFVAAGRRRELGRAFDLACVRVLPLLFVELVSTVVVRALDVDVPVVVMWLLAGASYAWCGGLVALGVLGQGGAQAAPAEASPVVASRAGLAIVAIAAIGAAFQVAFVVAHLADLRPMAMGDEAPALALPRIEAGGKLGEPVVLAHERGKPVVVDFWATWCKPCIASLPALDRFTRAPPRRARAVREPGRRGGGACDVR